MTKPTIAEAYTEIVKYQAKISSAKIVIDSLLMGMTEVYKKGCYTQLSDFAHELSKQAENISNYERHIGHVKDYISRELENSKDKIIITQL
jgi:hypothetical protein